jgi:EAL domain-containing protein (putative c-di-GMP-specific phosphodiesterase class I)/CheY-like chemotaxis protein
MDIQIQIYSLSSELTNINKILKDQIAIISPNDLYSSVIYTQSAYIIFQWSDINYIRRSINQNNIENTHYICIDEDISPENRLYLLNNNIEYLTKEKFSLANVNDFIVMTKRNKYKVLIIQDDAVQAMINESLLKTAGITVKVINTELDATEVIDFFHPDLVLIDLDHNKEITEYVLKSIRNKPDNLTLPIIFLSPDNSKITRDEIINLGADEVLLQPTKSEILVTSILNKIQGKFFESHENKLSILSLNPENHAVVDREFEELQDFIDFNADNSSASVIWFKIINKRSLQKNLGLSGFKNLCFKLLDLLPQNSIEFDLKLNITDGVFVVASVDLTRSKACQWVKDTQKWLQMQHFCIRNNEVNVAIQALILSDIPKKPNHNLMIHDAERLLNTQKSNQESFYLGEGEEQKRFYLIKAKLENAIKSENFTWLYQSILNTKDEKQEIFQLIMRVITSNNQELTSSDYFDVAHESGLLKLLDRFTLEHAITMIQDGEILGIQRRVLLNQIFNDYESETYRKTTLTRIKNYNLPEGRLIFQFRQDMTANHSNLIQQLGTELKQAGITICLSEFDATETAWQYAKEFSVDWIRIKPFSKNSVLLDKNSAQFVGNIIKKAQDLGYKVMLPNIDSANLTANIWNLNANFIQGNFIQEPVADIKFIENEAVG